MNNCHEEDTGLSFHPLDSSRWKDFERLFGSRGACGGCWCMAWRLKPSDFERMKGEGNRNAMKEIVNNGEVPGILAYMGKEPAGWCAVAPRENYMKLENSLVLKKVDDKPVWSITCFFIAKKWRRKGLSLQILREVIEHCGKAGARIIEGYPEEPYSESIPAAFAWKGIPSVFLKAGFVEVARRSKRRPIMRYYFED